MFVNNYLTFIVNYFIFFISPGQATGFFTSLKMTEKSGPAMASAPVKLPLC